MQDVGSAELRPYHRGMGSLRVVLCVIVAAGLVGVTGLAADDRVVKVYPLDLTDTASAAELVRGMLSPGGRVVEDAPNRRILVLDDHAIRLRVTPEFSYFLDRGQLISRVQQLSTEVIVREGEEIDLGGLPMSNREFKEKFFIGMGRTGQAERMNIRLRARVEP